MVGDIIQHLVDFQFRVGVPGGVEAILHVVNRMVHDNKDGTSLNMMLAEFKNAFNLANKEI